MAARTAVVRMVPLMGPRPQARPVPAWPTVPARQAPRSGLAPPTLRVMVLGTAPTLTASTLTASTRTTLTGMAPPGMATQLELAPPASSVAARPTG
jgi:hypothetical protein